MKNKFKEIVDCAFAKKDTLLSVQNDKFNALIFYNKDVNPILGKCLIEVGQEIDKDKKFKNIK